MDATNSRCLILASQPGDSAWAAAPQVSGWFDVLSQEVSLAWADEIQTLRPSDPVVVKVRVISQDPVDDVIFRMSTTTDSGDPTFCTATPESMTLHGETRVEITVTALRPPGPGAFCNLTATLMSQNIASPASGGSTLLNRAYPVEAVANG
ncbi:hypothetical protein ACQEVG_17495 [Streptomyces sp. CA-135486]|uniref:hypothetical protein n=1 Tax=Streptomyces sp. CA-135486 TaxID=3240049 RepID=UPI003D8F5BA0